MHLNKSVTPDGEWKEEMITMRFLVKGILTILWRWIQGSHKNT